MKSPMCAEYLIQTTQTEIETTLGTPLQNSSKSKSWNARIKMSKWAPVLEKKEGEIWLNERIFPVQPFPNARLSQLASLRANPKGSKIHEKMVRIYEVPLWKTGFESSPCLVPITGFFEATYWGEHRGKVMTFRDPQEKMGFVPAILVKPRKPETKAMNGFVLLTHTASDQMLQYHHRLLLLLKPKSALDYLNLGPVSPQERYDFLLNHRSVPQFITSVDRALAKGWDKRIQQHENALADEKKYRAALDTQGKQARVLRLTDPR